MAKCRQLTVAELRHLFHVVDMDRANGGYYGTRNQYEVRAERLLEWINQELSARGEARNGE